MRSLSLLARETFENLSHTKGINNRNGVCYLFIGEISFQYSKYLHPFNIRLLQKLLKSSGIVVVSMYATFRKSMKTYDRGPTILNKSHLIMIKTPTNHSSSCRDIVFGYVENHVGIVRQFLILKKG